MCKPSKAIGMVGKWRSRFLRARTADHGMPSEVIVGLYKVDRVGTWKYTGRLLTRRALVLIDRLSRFKPLASYGALGLYLFLATSQTYGLRYVISDLLQPERYASDTFSQLLAEVQPLRDRITENSRVYFVRSHDAEIVTNDFLKLSALQHALVPRVVQGTVWQPSRPLVMATRLDVEKQGKALQELYRFSDGGLVLCSCPP